MKVIGNNLGTNKVEGIYLNFALLFKTTLDNLGLTLVTKIAKQTNEQFNGILHTFFNDIECLSLFLFERGYKVMGIFKSEKSLKKYIDNNRIKAKIKNGQILIGNIYGEKNDIECVGIVLATKIISVNEKTNKILNC